jgi:hypothetical protein
MSELSRKEQVKCTGRAATRQKEENIRVSNQRYSESFANSPDWKRKNKKNQGMWLGINHRSGMYLYTDTNQLCATMRCKICRQIEGLESVYGEAQRTFKGAIIKGSIRTSAIGYINRSCPGTLITERNISSRNENTSMLNIEGTWTTLVLPLFNIIIRSTTKVTFFR